jgi:hypothetical protein
MTYRVAWAPFAENWLEQYLSAAVDRIVVAKAAKEIDRQLMTDPMEFGESRDGAVRIGYARPLGALFEVFDDVRAVVVYDVWRIDRA